MIDWNRVRELADELGQEDLPDIVELFLEEVSEAISDMQFLDPDTADMGAKMHFVKGSALNLGFAALADLCDQGERAVVEPILEPISAKNVKTCYEASLAEFTDGMGQICAAG